MDTGLAGEQGSPQANFKSEVLEIVIAFGKEIGSTEEAKTKHKYSV